jgi:drug/metabolite transporter (DMT)-like permease
MVIASVFIALSTFLAKGVAGRFEFLGADGIHPVQITAGRFIAAWALWFGVVVFRQVKLDNIHWRLHLIRTLLGWLTVTCVFWAGSLMALSDATAISFLTPVVTLVLAALFLREKVGWIRKSAVAIMLFGALLLLRPGTSAFQPAALIALLAAFTSGFESLFIKKITRLEPMIQILFVNNSIGIVLALSAAVWFWIWPTPSQWLFMGFVGISMTVAQVFFLVSMRDGDASFVIPFMYSTLIFASVLDYVVFGDSPDGLGALGAVIIVAGAVFLAWREGVNRMKLINSQEN